MRQKGKNSVREKKTFDDRVSSMSGIADSSAWILEKAGGKTSFYCRRKTCATGRVRIL